MVRKHDEFHLYVRVCVLMRRPLFCRSAIHKKPPWPRRINNSLTILEVLNSLNDRRKLIFSCFSSGIIALARKKDKC